MSKALHRWRPLVGKPPRSELLPLDQGRVSKLAATLEQYSKPPPLPPPPGYSVSTCHAWPSRSTKSRNVPSTPGHIWARLARSFQIATLRRVRHRQLFAPRLATCRGAGHDPMEHRGRASNLSARARARRARQRVGMRRWASPVGPT